MSTIMRWPTVRPWTGTLWRLVLAAVLLYAGGVKLLETDGARSAILAYRIFPVGWASFLGWALPVLEVALGLLLLVGLFTRLAALATGLLMLAFVAGIASVWIRGYSIDCGCFGGGGDLSADGRNARYTVEILRDIAFAAMAAWLVWWPRTRLSLDGLLAAPPLVGDLEDDYSDDDYSDDPVDEPDDDQPAAPAEEEHAR